MKGTGERTLLPSASDASGQLTAVGQTLPDKEVDLLGVDACEATEEDTCGTNVQASTTETDTEVVELVAENGAHRGLKGDREKVSKNKRVAIEDKGLGVARRDGKKFAEEEALQLYKAWVQQSRKNRIRPSRGCGPGLYSIAS